MLRNSPSFGVIFVLLKNANASHGINLSALSFPFIVIKTKFSRSQLDPFQLKLGPIEQALKHNKCRQKQHKKVNITECFTKT